jgi:hypothetical protein
VLPEEVACSFPSYTHKFDLLPVETIHKPCKERSLVFGNIESSGRDHTIRFLEEF